MSAPTSINFDGLVDENDAVPTWQGGGWTVSFLNGTSIEAIELNNNIAPISTGSDYALFVTGDAPGLGGDAVSFAGTSGEEFLLQSFAILRYEAGSDSMDPDIRVVGYRNGSPVAGALQDFSLPTNGSPITVTFSGAAWDGIDEFRIVQQNGTRDFYFLIDDIAVGATTLDTTPPTATIVVADTALKIGETTGVTITFSEAVTGFTNADLIVSNGTLSAVSSSDGGITWTATFTPTANITDPSNLITLGNTGVVDAAGNAGTGTTNSNNYAIDTVRPTATIVVSNSALVIGQTSLVTITFSEAVAGFTLADLTASNGTLAGLSTSDGGITWTATLTPAAGITDTTNLITLANTGVADLAGNAGSGTTNSDNYAIDTVRPTGTIVVADSALGVGQTSLVTITFSEAVTGFTLADLTASNGTLAGLSTSDGGITWTATLTPAAGITDTTNLITLANTGVADLAGNAGSGTTNSDNYAIDTVRPTATIVVANTALRIGQTSLVTITFSEAVTGFTNADLTIANGTLSAVSSSDGGVTWTATFTPSANITDTTNLITLDNSGVVDWAGNAGPGTTDSNNYAVDTMRPTGTIVVADSALGVGQTSLVTITFSEAVTGFTNADLTISNGTLSAVSSSDGGITWMATFTPVAGITDTTNLITLDNTGVADAAGNAGSGTTDSNNYAVDSHRPTATIVVADPSLKAGETSLVTFTFSEAVTGFDNTDLSIANGTLSTVSSSDGGITWTATLTPTAGIADMSNLITLNNAGLADLAGNAGTGTTNSANYTIDTVRPTATIIVADTALKAGEQSLVTVTFSEAVSGFTNADLIIANGTLSAVSSSDGGTTWTATFTPVAGIADMSNVITLDNSGVVNISGNAGSGTTDSNNYAVDTVRPTATIVVADSALAVGETTLVTFTFSEAVTGFTNADLTVSNGSLSAVTSSDGGVTWTATFTPIAGTNDTSNVITLDDSGVLNASGNAGFGTTASGNYIIDSLLPEVASISGPAPGTYHAGQSLDFVVNMSEAAIVDTSFGTPRFAVQIGSQVAYAEYLSGSGSNTLMFRLIVTTGQWDLDGIAVGTTLDLNGGSIRDGAGNTVKPTLNNVGPTSNVIVDASGNVAPALTGDLAATVKEGGSYKLTTTDLNFSDPDDTASGVRFTVSSQTAGKVLVNGTAATSFNGAELAAGKVSFVHDGSETTNASFKVSVEDGNEDGSTPVKSNFNFTVTPVNDAPTLTGDLKATVKEGGSYRITTADLNFSDPDDSASGVRFTVSSQTAGKVQVNGKAATSFTGAELASGKVSFVHSGAELTKASFKVAVEDGNEDGSTPVAGTFNLAVTPVNDAPTLTGDLKATVKEGGSYRITTADLNFSDPDDSASGVRFTVSAASNGKVQVNGKAAASFTGAELASGKVSFVHSGAESTKASFKVAVEDGNEDGSTPVKSNFNFSVTPVNDAPTLTGELKATVKEGGSYRITTADLNFSDPDDSASGVRFTVSAASNGKVQVNGKAATSFTGAELAAGKVSFVHDGSETANASFKVSVEDGNEDGSTPVKSNFNFTVTPVNDAPELVSTQTLRQIAEDASTASARKVATLKISDPDGGNNKLSLAGSDAKLFEIKNGALWLKKGAKLDYETNPSLKVTVRLDDPSIGTKHEDWQTFKVAVTDVAETKRGTSGKDKLTGTSAADVLDGKGGNDVLSGGSGDDRLIGGSGVDIMTGGSGRDTFVFTSVKDSAPGQSGLVNNGGYNPLSGSDKRDIITDFVHAQDKLDLSKIDADSTRSGNQDFVWRGKNDFTGKSGEVIFRIFDEKGTENDRTIVYGDTDRDQQADFQIELTGIIGLTKGDFIL